MHPLLIAHAFFFSCFSFNYQKIHSGLIRLESEEKFSYVIIQKRALTKYEKGKADREGTQLMKITIVRMTDLCSFNEVNMQIILCVVIVPA